MVGFVLLSAAQSVELRQISMVVSVYPPGHAFGRVVYLGAWELA